MNNETNSDLLYRIRAKSVMGWPSWVTKVTETPEGSIISMTNRVLKGKRFRKEDAEELLSKVHTCHPKAEIVPAPEMPYIVCLCGSTRFWKTFQEQSLALTKKGIIVLSTASDDENGIMPEEKVMFDELHKRKIELADKIFVLNVGGYIGESTRSEIDHAIANGKGVIYLESVNVESVATVAVATPSSADDASLIETLCICLIDAHNEILKLQNCPAEEWKNYDWPEWSGPANTIRWAEKRLGKKLAKTATWTMYPPNSKLSSDARERRDETKGMTNEK